MSAIRPQTNSIGKSNVDHIIECLSGLARKWFYGVTSIIAHGSTARKEYTLYTAADHDILLGNAGLMLVTSKPVIDGAILPFFLCYIRNAARVFHGITGRLLTLVKPFEMTMIARSSILEKKIAPDIWSFEMVKANSVLYGENLLPLFPTGFGREAGLKMVVARMAGLSLSLPYIIREEYDTELKRIIINYESVKGILGGFETLLVIMKRYLPSYRERASLAREVAATFPGITGKVDAAAFMEQAFRFKLNPHGLAEINPGEYWRQAQQFLANCLDICQKEGYEVSSGISETKLAHRLRKMLLNGKPCPDLLMHSSMQTAMMMLDNVLSFPSDYRSSDEAKKCRINKTRKINHLYTYGAWQEITDNIRRITPGQGQR
ncbi:hypothetical protein ACFLXZ_01790 [Chloroflexota bacterium]